MRRSAPASGPGIGEAGGEGARRHAGPEGAGAAAPGALGTAAALALLHLALALLAFVPAPHPGGDNGVYLALARSLLEGGYHDLFDPAAPPHRQFPPGWPATIALGLLLGLRPWVGLKLLIVGFSTAGAALAYLWLRRRTSPGLALGAGVGLAMSPGLLALSHWELSDVPFWTLTAAALLLWERVPGAGPRGEPGRVAAASALTALAFLTRVAGLPLALAAGGWLALGRRWRALAVHAAVALPPVAAWALWTGLFGGYLELVGSSAAYAPSAARVSPAGLLARVAENAWSYQSRFLPILVGGNAAAPLALVAAALSLLALAGWAARLRRPGVPELWAPLYAAMLLLWNPEWAGERLLLPLYPLLLLWAGETLTRRAPAGGGGLGRRVPAAGALVLVLAALPGVVGAARLGTACTRAWRAGDPHACLEPAWRDFLALAEEAGEALPEGAAVLSRKPALFWAESGHPGRTYPPSRDPADLLRAAREAGARWVVLDDLDALATQYLTPLLIRRPAAFCVVRSPTAERATLLGIRGDAERVPDARGDPGAAEVTVAFQACGPDDVEGFTPLVTP